MANPPPVLHISFRNASRWYGQVIGLNDVSCDVGPGLTALLGPNGAGKSTFIKLVTGQLRPTTGGVQVLGQSPFANAYVLGRLGYCPEIDNFYEDMSGREFVTQMGAMSGFSGAELKKRVDATIERVGMSDRCDRKIGGYSKGMRQRIKFAQAVLHDPQVLVLDEPLNGLDPVGRRDMVNLMNQVASAGCCVLVSSHILHEVEQLTNNILLMQRGRLLARGSVQDIRDEMDRDTQTPRHIQLTVSEPRRLAAELFGMPSVTGVRLNSAHPNHLEIETNNPRELFTVLPEIILAGNYTIESLQSPDDHLEAMLRILLSRK